DEMTVSERTEDTLLLTSLHSPALIRGRKEEKKEQVNSQRYFGCFSYLSYHGNVSVHNYSLEPAFIHKRNERERQRVRCVNEGYARLREHLPQEFEDKRLSKVETLRAAINYIKHLQHLLEVSLPQGMPKCNVESKSNDFYKNHGVTVLIFMLYNHILQFRAF
uniref:BHLH domain-containing protein n=1 Tax=Cyprinus carpio TaxID=7962 RepID=A0A8C2EDR8_CYPCA